MSVEKLVDVGAEILGLVGIFLATLVISGHSCNKAVACGKVPGVSQASK